MSNEHQPTEANTPEPQALSVAPCSASGMRTISSLALYWATQYRETCLAADMAGEHYPKLQDYIQRALDEHAATGMVAEIISAEQVDAYLGAHFGVNLDDIMAQHIREGGSPCS